MPEPVKFEIVPLVATMSVATKLIVDLERVKVMVAVWPLVSDVVLLVTTTVGAVAFCHVYATGVFRVLPLGVVSESPRLLMPLAPASSRSS